MVGVSGYLVGNSLLSEFGSEQDININSDNINNSFFIKTITLRYYNLFFKEKYYQALLKFEHLKFYFLQLKIYFAKTVFYFLFLRFFENRKFL